MKIHGIPASPFINGFPRIFPLVSVYQNPYSIKIHEKKLKCHCPSIVHPFPMSHSDCFVVKTTHFSGQLTGSSPSSSARKRSNGCGSKNSSRSYGRAIGKTRDGWGYGMKNGSGWWFEPLRKIWKSVGSFLNISQLGWLSHILWKIKKCSKPPTSGWIWSIMA